MRQKVNPNHYSDAVLSIDQQDSEDDGESNRELDRALAAEVELRAQQVLCFFLSSIHTDLYIYICVCIYIYIYMYVYICICVCV